MESAAGLAALALFVLWLGYWVPHRLRHRQQLLDSRVDDRFSGGLRVLAVAGGPAGVVTPLVEPRRSVPLLVASASTSDAGGGERRMPEVRTGRALERGPATDATPAVRTSRLAVLERRAARARRRLILALLLTALTAAGWAAVGLGYALWWAGAAPTGLLVLVLVLGALAARSARRADAGWMAERRAARRGALQARALANGGPYAPRNRTRVIGRAVHPSGNHTQMIPRVDVGARAAREPSATRTEKVSEAQPSELDALLQSEEPAPRIIEQPAPGASASLGVGGPAWDPVPVPLPTYVTKPEAPRREPKPLTGGTPVAAARLSAAAEDATTASGTTADVPVSAADAQALADELRLATEPPPQRTETLGLPLEQILARRRAAG